MNVRPKEHERAINNKDSLSHLAAHCDDYKYTAKFDTTTCLHKHRDQRAKEILEGHIIRKRGDKCIIQPSVRLSQQEVVHLDKNMWCNS